MSASASDRPGVVIIGGGFGGLYAARALARSRAELDVTLVDRRNFHLFQPLLYQVATGGLSPADIAAPLRALFRRHRNVRVLEAEVTEIELDERVVLCGEDGKRVPYDYLVVATGATHHYFGNEHWAENAPGLKSIEDATAIRARVLEAFESAERETDETRRRALLTFAIVGGGPTGVELAGALAELARHTLREDFRAIDTSRTSILLLEAADRLLLAYPASLSNRARTSLEELGVEVRLETMVKDIREGVLTVERGGAREEIAAATVLWAAGVAATPLGRQLAAGSKAECDRAGRVVVEPDLSLAGRPEVFVIGDLASFRHQPERGDEPLPGVAPVAMQQGRYVARAIVARTRGETFPPFRYRDRGSLAVIGRARAVALLGKIEVSGYPAWLLWLFIHLLYLVAFENRVIVFIQWAWNYLTRNRRARLITRVKG